MFLLANKMLLQKCVNLIAKVLGENPKIAFPGAVSWPIMDVPKGRRVVRQKLHSFG